MNTALTLTAPKPEKQFRKITLKDQDLKSARLIQEQYKLSPVAARVLAARSICEDKELQQYLSPSLKEGLPDPKQLLHLEEACELIAHHVAQQHSLALCCDFDVDGLSGGSLVSRFLHDASVVHDVYVPDRFTEGYGLNEQMIRSIHEAGHSLVVTIDYGTTNKKEIALAKELGLDVIVLDHHHVGTHDPGADVFINPQQDQCGFADGILCAAGLSWYLVLALKHHLATTADIDVRRYLDLACLGTICDMVPLVQVNRVIARRGLETLTVTNRPGLLAMKKVIGIHGDVNGGHIGFGIGPRINAAGRMLSGKLVIDLLVTDDSKKAMKIAKRLNRLNEQRQDIEGKIKELAMNRVASMERLPWGIVVWDKSFHTGVIGIVAQRLSEAFYRPSIVAGSDGDLFKGSVRGIQGFSVIEALTELGDYLVKFGGHPGAGGFSIEADKIDEFARAFNALCEQKLQTLRIVPHTFADTSCTLQELTPDLVDELAQFAPFGVGNPSPQLLFEGLTVTKVQKLKGNHLKCWLSDGHHEVQAVLWSQADHPALQEGSLVDVAGKPGMNTFRGMKQLQITLQAAQFHDDC